MSRTMQSPWRATLGYLIRDTFRQSMAHGIFLVLLGISLLSIVICLSISVAGQATMAQGDEPPDFLSRRESEAQDADKLKGSGVSVAEGQLTLAFGAIKVPLARDTRSAVHFLELVLAGGVADTLGLLLALIWTAGFLPGFLDGNNIRVLLAKPAPRGVLLLGKYLGVLAFVLVNSIIFVGGTWAAIGLRTGYWDPAYLLSIPLLLLHFSVFFGFSVLLAVCTGNAVVCVFGSIVFWCVTWSMNIGRHVFFLADDTLSTAMQSPLLATLVDLGYWVLPKPADFEMLLYRALEANDSFGTAVDMARLDAAGFSITLSVLSSLVFAAVMLFTATRKFQAVDY